MKFAQLISSKTVPEWKKSYLDYQLLKKTLIPFKLTQKLCVKTKFYKGEESINLVGMKQDDQQFQKFKGMFESNLISEIDKINQFFQFKLLNVIHIWKGLYESYLHINCKRKKLASDFDKQYKNLKTAFHAFYRQIRLLKGYADINKDGIRKILKKYKKYTRYIITSDDLVEKIQFKTRDGFLQRNEEKLNTLISEVEAVYLSFFYTRFNRKRGKEELEKAYNFQGDSSNLFMFGIFTGLAILLICLIFYGVSQDETTSGTDAFSLIFPIYRGIGLIILYQWLIGWNVYIWEQYQVNYKLIFKFNHHFSTVSQILQRAAIFTFLFLLSFFAFTIVKQHEQPTLQGVLPLLVWVAFLGYIFFPSEKWFNPQGRKYFYKLLKLILCMPFRKMEFRIGWATDQLVSFITPLKDLVTAILFYTCDFSSNKVASDRTSSIQQIILTGFVMATIPSIMRSIQCCRAMYDEKQYFGTNNFYNLLKYQSSLLTSILSFMLSLIKFNKWDSYQTPFLVVWIISSAVSTLYSYYWDLKKDWGFLTKSKNKWLRDHLVYKNPNIYYAVFISNFILRLAWVFNISPGFQVSFIPNKDLFNFVIGLLEMFRRCQWNLFRVELEHVKNCDSFKAVDDTSLAIQNLDSTIQKDYQDRDQDKMDRLQEKQNLVMHKQAMPKHLIENIKNHFFSRYYQKDESFEINKINKEINIFKNRIYSKHN
ncbi:hypothetical protein ABPG74_004926 [Tetrahymena malaccensis]